VESKSTQAPKLLFVSTVHLFLDAFLLPHATYVRSLGWRVDGAAHGIRLSRQAQHVFDRTFEIPWSRSPRHFASMLRGFWAMRELIQNERYDIVHVHTPIAALLTRLAVASLPRDLRPAVVYTAHGFFFHLHGSWLPNRVHRMLEQWGARWTDQLVVINDEDEQAAKRYHLALNAPPLKIPGVGIDAEDLRVRANRPPSGRSSYRVAGIPDTSPVLLMVSEFNPGKRHRDALLAFASLESKDAHLVLVGAGPLRSSIEALARSLCIHDRVHFFGTRHDVPALMTGATLLLHPSEREGLSVSIQEAMALGLPVVGSKARGVIDLLSSGAGFLFSVGDVRQLREQIDIALRRPELREQAAHIGKRESPRYQRSAILQTYEAVYHKLLANRPAQMLRYRAA